MDAMMTDPSRFACELLASSAPGAVTCPGCGANDCTPATCPAYVDDAGQQYIGQPIIFEGDRVEITTGHPFRGVVTVKDYGAGDRWSYWVRWDDRPFPDEGPYGESDLRLVRRGGSAA